ncbi:uncharacterized protein LOC131181402 [Hevea brasiliensis]|uniref:uncharacterized protein LOC131181402 n=1 Tax=Hevea brasiliensis TaxID=3981 RepID=UPI0025F895BF|nr:uncharacterized protein LOC131181402 [Hevea brasiliensis]
MVDKGNTIGSTTSSRRTDPGWAHIIEVSENNTNDLQCMYCMKVYKGRVNRIKKHLTGGCKNIVRYSKYPKDVRNQMQEFIIKKREQKSVMNMKRPPEFDDVEVLGIDENQEEEELMQEISSRKRRQTINVSGTVDASDESKTVALLASLIEKELMEIDPKKIVQVVIDNVSNNVAASKIFI